MIGNIKKYGNYIVLAPKTAIPHSRTEDGVLKLGMSLTVFKNDIDFKEKEKDNVRLFIVLAAIDGDKHLKALQSLTKILSSEDSINEIINAPSIEEVLNILKKYT
jgi:mannitol/fructose-specific phosphotransferase system IIA component (Ntr-type)